jgi:hypothetical protein
MDLTSIPRVRGFRCSVGRCGAGLLPAVFFVFGIKISHRPPCVGKDKLAALRTFAVVTLVIVVLVPDCGSQALSRETIFACRKADLVAESSRMANEVRDRGAGFRLWVFELARTKSTG